MKNTSEIGILGCGWLGKATAKCLINKGFKVRGSTTSNKGSKALKEIGVKPFVIHLKPESPIKDLETFLKGLHTLVISIPPKFSQGESQLLDSFKLMFENYDFTVLKKLIYISSTGVFKDGEDITYDEDSITNNNSDRGQCLIRLEKFILNQNFIENKYIIRYGGLIQRGGRHPVHYLSGKKGIKNPFAPVNLIEQADAASLLCKLVENIPNRVIFHGVYPSHPNRMQYYRSKAKELNLIQPEFSTDEISLGKTILSRKTQTDLNFKFKNAI